MPVEIRVAICGVVGCWTQDVPSDTAGGALTLAVTEEIDLFFGELPKVRGGTGRWSQSSPSAGCDQRGTGSQARERAR